VSTRQVTQEEIDRALLAETPQQRLTQVDVSPWDIADVGAQARERTAVPWRPTVDYATGFEWAAADDVAVTKPAATVAAPSPTRHLKVRFLRTETFEAELEAPLTLEVEDLTNKELQALVFRHALTKTTRTVNLDNDDIVIQSIEIIPPKREPRPAAPRKVFTLIREDNSSNDNYDSPAVLGVFASYEAASAAREVAADEYESATEGIGRVYYRHQTADAWEVDYTIHESEVEG
jgi:hypothetical protein